MEAPLSARGREYYAWLWVKVVVHGRVWPFRLPTLIETGMPTKAHTWMNGTISIRNDAEGNQSHGTGNGHGKKSLRLRCLYGSHWFQPVGQWATCRRSTARTCETCVRRHLDWRRTSINLNVNEESIEGPSMLAIYATLGYSTSI